MSATIRDIAKKTGLSLATISKYINGGNVRPDNRRLIDAAVKELHFVPNEFARGLKTSQSKTIGVVIPELSNAFITSIISNIEDLLRQQNYAVIVCDCRSDAKREQDAVTFLMQKRVDGLINMPTDPTGAHLLSAIGAGIPVVLVDRMLKPLAGRISAVIVDNVDAAETATRHLIDAGHTSIALILGNEDIFTTQKRREGYLNALREHRIVPRDGLIRYSDYTMQGGYAAMKKLLALSNRPTAAFVTNYEMTLGALIAVSEAKLAIPGDLSFIGFDKLDIFGDIYPNLTLIKQPQNAIGECVAKQLLALLADGSALRQTIVLNTQLHAGATVQQILPGRSDAANGNEAD